MRHLKLKEKTYILHKDFFYIILWFLFFFSLKNIIGGFQLLIHSGNWHKFKLLLKKLSSWKPMHYVNVKRLILHGSFCCTAFNSCWILFFLNLFSCDTVLQWCESNENYHWENYEWKKKKKKLCLVTCKIQFLIWIILVKSTGWEYDLSINPKSWHQQIIDLTSAYKKCVCNSLTVQVNRYSMFTITLLGLSKCT